MGWDGVYDQDVEVAHFFFQLPRPDELLRELFASTLVARVLASLVLGVLLPCVLLLYSTPQLWLRVLRRRSGLRETRLFAGGIHYAALEKGGVEGSSTVLFLHDQLTDKDVWHDVCSKFDPERFHLLVPDLPGYGATVIAESGYCHDQPSLGFAEEATHDPNAFTGVDELAEALYALVGRAVGQHRRVHLVGLGYGCSIAAAFASLYPDSVRSVTALSPLGMSEPIPKAQFVDLLKGVRESRAAFTKLVRSLSTSPAAFRPPAISGAVWDGWGARGRAPPLNHTTNEHYSKRGFFRSVDEEVAVPTMILCGAEDGFTKEKGASLVLEFSNDDRAVAGVECSIIGRAGYLLPLEKGVAERIVGFIDSDR